MLCIVYLSFICDENGIAHPYIIQKQAYSLQLKEGKQNISYIKTMELLRFIIG
jgi:hypothetical protein